MAGEHLAEVINIDKHYWIEDPDREDYGFKEDPKNIGNSKFDNALS